MLLVMDNIAQSNFSVEHAVCGQAVELSDNGTDYTASPDQKLVVQASSVLTEPESGNYAVCPVEVCNYFHIPEEFLLTFDIDL